MTKREQAFSGLNYVQVTLNAVWNDVEDLSDKQFIQNLMQHIHAFRLERFPEEMARLIENAKPWANTDGA